MRKIILGIFFSISIFLLFASPAKAVLPSYDTITLFVNGERVTDNSYTVDGTICKGGECEVNQDDSPVIIQSTKDKNIKVSFLPDPAIAEPDSNSWRYKITRLNNKISDVYDAICFFSNSDRVVEEGKIGYDRHYDIELTTGEYIKTWQEPEELEFAGIVSIPIYLGIAVIIILFLRYHFGSGKKKK